MGLKGVGYTVQAIKLFAGNESVQHLLHAIPNYIRRLNTLRFRGSNGYETNKPEALYILVWALGTRPPELTQLGNLPPYEE